MSHNDENELFLNAINQITERLSEVLLQEYLKLPEKLQKSLVLTKSSELLLANVVCQIAMNRQELSQIVEELGEDMKELIESCAVSGFAEKFEIHKH